MEMVTRQYVVVIGVPYLLYSHAAKPASHYKFEIFKWNSQQTLTRFLMGNADISGKVAIVKESVFLTYDRVHCYALFGLGKIL